MGLTDISWPGLFIGVSAPTYLLLGLSRPKPRRLSIIGAKPPQTPALREAISQAHPAFASRPPDGGESARFKRWQSHGPGRSIHTGAPPQTPALREAISQAHPAFTPRPPDGGESARFKHGNAQAIARVSSEQPFVKFTCARPLLIINKLRSLNCAGEHNLLPPATLQKVNILTSNQLAKQDVAGEFHEAQASGIGQGLRAQER